MLIRTFERSPAISVRLSLVRYSVIDREQKKTIVFKAGLTIYIKVCDSIGTQKAVPCPY